MNENEKSAPVTDIETFLEEYGIGLGKTSVNPMDHIVSECEIMERLALGAAEENGLDGKWSKAYEEFLQDHIRFWVPRFAQITAEQSSEKFYVAAAMWLSAFLKSQNN
ncbi:MAG: molecular chaperone TorD family protein [Eggerthellaceae bacterium]|nr:molecular chaperone TorD family protein [Eggerthellaceae bacterium]